MNTDQTINGALNVYTDSALSISSNLNNVINVNKISSVVNTVNKLNSVISSMYGVTAKWFRAVPNSRSKDVIFHEYTLSNVEDCGFDINIMYTDTGYDDAALQYTMMGIQYQIPLTCEISLEHWNAATNNDGSLPQKNDIVYIPQSNKLYQVVSMNPIRTVASQITSYRCNLAIYKHKASIALNSELEETIDNYTDSINKVFGEDIIDEILDATAPKQTSPKNSTYKDEYKHITNYDLIYENNKIFNGHNIFKRYYKNTPNIEYLVKYNASDIITSGRCLSLNVRLIEQENIPMLKLTTDKINKYNSHFVEYYYGDLSALLNIDKQNLKTLDTNFNDNVKNSVNNLLKSYCSNNLLCGKSSNDTILSIDITRTYLIITINDKKTFIKFNKSLKNNNWYNITLNLDNNSNCTIFDLEDNINIIDNIDFNLKYFDDLIIDNYQINGSEYELTNIRLFNTIIDNIDKKIINAISQFSEHESKLIIADNCDEVSNANYYGAQR
jgi:hypothetical protein